MKTMNITELCSVVNGILISGTSDRAITECSISSKEGGECTLFVPLVGERVDAHDYILDAYEHGARSVLSARKDIVAGTEGMTYILVQDTLSALQALAAWYRNKVSLPLVGITGSVGKTTTKEMVAAALSTKMDILKTAGNKNSQIGLSQMMLELMDTHEAAVIEMGMSLEGEMERLAKIAKPTTALITNIGVSHIGQLGSQENIRREKLNIINEMPEDGALLICGDDPMLMQLRDDSSKVSLNNKTREVLRRIDLITYGINQTNDYYAKDIKQDQETTEFTFSWTDSSGINLVERIKLNVIGLHNVKNAVAALVIALRFGIHPAEAKKGLEEYRPLAMRGNIETIGSITLIDDTYNASPDSMKSGLDVLESISGTGNKIAVLADILELGEVSKVCHKEVGDYVAGKQIQTLVTIGNEAKWIAKAVNDYIDNQIQTQSFDSNSDAYQYLSQIIEAGDIIFLKGSRGMKLDEIANQLRNR